MVLFSVPMTYCSHQSLYALAMAALAGNAGLRSPASSAINVPTVKKAAVHVQLTTWMCRAALQKLISENEDPRSVLKNARNFTPKVDREDFVQQEDKGAKSGDDGTALWYADGRLFEGCEVGQKLRVAVLLSGGVDSSVALRLLCEAGHECTAYYLKIWFQEDFDNFWSRCPWEEDLTFAQDVCDEVGVDLKVVHLTDEYWSEVVAHSISEIKAGRTPNPDILCNTRIKFGSFFDHIDFNRYDRAASGHYARVERIVGSSGSTQTVLKLSADELKDQTYFLSHLTQDQLSRLLFPLGGLSKPEVRKIADAMNLSNKARKDSQGICFLGKVRFSEFISKHLGENEGRIVEAESGVLLGKHSGFWFYTIGQRHGIRLSGGPWFVVAKDIQRNVIFVSKNYFAKDKQRSSFRICSLSWLAGYPPESLADLRCKVRHGPKMYRCSVRYEEQQPDSSSTTSSPGDSTAFVRIAENDQGLAPGQFAAFYNGDVCLGSGVIIDDLDHLKFYNVSAEALEAARTGDHPQQKIVSGTKERPSRRTRPTKFENATASTNTNGFWQSIKKAIPWLLR